MSEEQKLILISDFIEQKLRKEQELDFYLQELEELQRKIGWLRREVELTNTIISMIKHEQVSTMNKGVLFVMLGSITTNYLENNNAC